MKIFAYSLLLTVCFAMTAFGQAAGNITKVDLSQPEIDKIIKKVTQNEALFRQALNVYAFNRNAVISEMGMGGQVAGTYKRDSYLTFSEGGERFEKILFAPVSTMRELQVTAADIDNLGGIDPFAIEPKVADQYRFTLLGKEKIDELNLYVFEVEPKVMPDAKKGIAKYFSGRIWVDDADLMIVKSKGKAVPEGKERFPVIETWRENIDGKYWFPSFSSADDELVFEKGQVIRMKVRVKYSNYRLGRTDVKIVEEEDLPPEPAPAATPTPTPKKP